MQIPNEVKIGGLNFKVVSSDETIILNARQCKGMIDYEFHTIKIDNTLQDVQGQEQTFLHEVLHGIIYDRKIDLQDDEEDIVDDIAIGLHQVIKDNPHIFKEVI